MPCKRWRGKRGSGEREVGYSNVSAAMRRWHTSGINSFDRRLRNRVGVFAYVILDTVVIATVVAIRAIMRILMNVIGPDCASIFEVNNIGGCV